MASDMFLDFDGEIKGESRDHLHFEEIDVLVWAWGASQSGSFHVGGGGGQGKANFDDLTITKYIDKASPALLKRCSDGHAIDRGKLTVRKAG